MITIDKRELKEEHKYCPRCGGFVDFNHSRVLLVHPPIHQYVCTKCHQIAISVRGD